MFRTQKEFLVKRHRAYWILRNLTAGQIQAYAPVSTLKRIGYPKKATGPIISRVVFVRGAGIPASTISRFQSNEWTPRERTIKKLSDFYLRYQQLRLRSAGMNREDARKYSKKPPEDIALYIRKYKKWAQRISDNYKARGEDVPVYAILWGMSHSSHDYNQWEMISLISGTKKK